MTKKYEMLKVKDPSDKNHIKIPILADLPFRIAIVGKSQLSGKTTIILNLLLRKKYYRNYFKGNDIYIISNNNVDKKLSILMENLEIPESNFMNFDPDLLDALYDNLEEEHEQEKKKLHKLIIFDDVAYVSGGLKGSQQGIMSKYAMNSRHILVNMVISSQKFSLLGTNIRSQLTSIFIAKTSTKELELIEQDVNFLDNKKEFMKLMRDNTKGRDFVFINFTNTEDEGMYLNANFEKIA
jgi:hypothetical protein